MPIFYTLAFFESVGYAGIDAGNRSKKWVVEAVTVVVSAANGSGYGSSSSGSSINHFHTGFLLVSGICWY